MISARFAEEANYWSTTVHPAKSQGEIIQRLEDFGTRNLMITQGQMEGQVAWLIRFEWREATYRFTFIPLKCRHPDKVSKFGTKRRSHEKQARYQMGRVAVHFVKAILTAAEMHHDALFGFVELPEAGTYPSGLPMTAGELNIEQLTKALPKIDTIPLLETGKANHGDNLP